MDHDAALRVLRSTAAEAKRRGYAPSSRFSGPIQEIVTGTHLTYRYLLVTGLLAKATDAKANPLALQAGADLEGAYDARSLCHKVIVPKEATLLDGALGASNEPFLNKPARFPTIDLGNAVRGGKDKRMLETLHGVLGSLRSAAEAKEGLQDAIYFAIERKATDDAGLKRGVGKLKGKGTDLRAYVEKLTEESHHGETALLAAAGVLWLMARTLGQDWEIVVHPSNESGSSSNQVGDIDVKRERKIVQTLEVKDKTFTARDVDHAVGKVRVAGLQALHFIEGPNATLTGATDATVVADARLKGVELHLLELMHWAKTTIAFAPPDISLREFAEAISRFAAEARVKEETLRWLRALAVDGATEH